ncbi:GDSL-like protein [Marvinbryantia formatexigens DSM 14469]|uniref:GDSL-like protein n=1 Tax=Marvinbryantia formatexigens DSM 14469 TaxID=478749 RepID=C6L9A6_9FIRM|nr:SGNH/GDSL hydrolase family protein [Marvinbryantia formatexigens]EET62845.1 GDSL-like protein [Marvinbryantia formatexigens DSM 14469]UWO23190.1 SGNH/GDSL hydrolase family protein [Marvinbryantia formatexigens DSM 14469]SDG02988.1 Lysophospholipase L1 [Marvinbryantia formatexigens]
MKHIVCFGDSNTHGYRAEDNGRFDETQRWTQLLQKKLGGDYLVIEEGLSGRTTCFSDPIHEGLNGLDYIYPCLMSHEPVDLLIIMLGTNDTKERFGSSAACIALGLKRLIAKAIATTDCWRGGKPEILVVTPQNIGREYADTEVALTMGRGCAEKSEGLAAQYQQIAELMGCHYLDANQVISVGPNQIDYMHLTEEGHRQLAQALAEKISTIL